MPGAILSINQQRILTNFGHKMWTLETFSKGIFEICRRSYPLSVAWSRRKWVTLKRKVGKLVLKNESLGYPNVEIACSYSH